MFPHASIGWGNKITNNIEMITSSIVFDHRSRTEKGKEGPVEIRLTVDRKPYYFQTGVKCLAREFVAGVIVDRDDADILNERVRILRDKLMSAVNRYMASNMEIDVQAIRRQIWHTKSENSNLLAWIEQQVPLLQLQPGTIRHYQTLLLRLREYELMMTWGDVTVANIYQFDAWLHSLRGWNGQLISDASVYNYHKCFKALLQRAVRFGIILANPYDRLRGEFRRGDKETVDYLTEDEMHRIEELNLQPGSFIEKARDLFVFQMYTGLSYGDAQAFDFTKYRLEDGAYIYIGERQKTGVQYVSRLLPPALEIVEKYRGSVPKIDNSDYNRLLKGIGVAANIHTPLHSHIARHTFATYMLSHRIGLDSVSVMLGHKNTVQTRRYAKTLASTVREDFDRIAETLKK